MLVAAVCLRQVYHSTMLQVQTQTACGAALLPLKTKVCPHRHSSLVQSFLFSLFLFFHTTSYAMDLLAAAAADRFSPVAHLLFLLSLSVFLGRRSRDRHRQQSPVRHTHTTLACLAHSHATDACTRLRTATEASPLTLFDAMNVRVRCCSYSLLWLLFPSLPAASRLDSTSPAATAAARFLPALSRSRCDRRIHRFLPRERDVSCFPIAGSR